jgi:hypothetical protein
MRGTEKGVHKHFMPRGQRRPLTDASLLEAALTGFEQMRRNVEEKIADIRRLLGSGGGTQAALRQEPQDVGLGYRQNPLACSTQS